MNEKEEMEAAKNSATDVYFTNHSRYGRSEMIFRDGFDAGFAAASQWVAITERLPAKSGEFDVSTNANFTDIADFIDGRWYDQDGEPYTIPEITAWRERPDPYQQGETNA